MRTKWTRRDIARGCGYGDNILATVHDPEKCWYWLEVNEERGIFNHAFKAKRGVIRIDPQVMAWAEFNMPEGLIVIEPNVKRSFSGANKDWGFQRWQALVHELEAPLIQFVYPGARILAGVQMLETPSFWHAAAALSLSGGLLSTNGGLQYAAAALGVSAVIVWGAFAPASVLGYDFHVAIEEPDSAGLGQRRNHPACRAAMDRITVERVAIEATKLWTF